MYIFKNENDLIELVERCAERADRQASDQSNLKREQMVARARAAAFHEVLAYLKDYFAARQKTTDTTNEE